MKMFKNALLFGGIMATFALTSCLKGGNSASYTSIGTVTTDKMGQTVFYADNTSMTYRADTDILDGYIEGSMGTRITCKMDINYDNQTSNNFTTATISNIKKLDFGIVHPLMSEGDTTGMSKDTMFVTPITATTSLCIQQKQYYINLNINYLAQKKDAGPEHKFLIFNDIAETEKSKTDIYLLLVHDENGEIPGGKEMKTALKTYDVSELIMNTEKKTEGKIHLKFYSSKGESTIQIPFINFDLDNIQ